MYPDVPTEEGLVGLANDRRRRLSSGRQCAQTCCVQCVIELQHRVITPNTTMNNGKNNCVMIRFELAIFTLMMLPRHKLKSCLVYFLRYHGHAHSMPVPLCAYISNGCGTLGGRALVEVVAEVK
jgi:hypothetical protein